MDSRYPCHYLMDRRVHRLSDAAHRLLVTATAWSVENRTDGEIEHDDLPLIPRARPEDMQALVSAGLADTTERGWILTEFRKYQTSAAKLEAALEARREGDRRRQAKSRAKRKQDADVDPETGEVLTPERVSRDGHVTDGGEERRGEERRGKAFEGEAVTSWPVADIPQSSESISADEEFPVDLPEVYCHTFGCGSTDVDDDNLCPAHRPAAGAMDDFERGRRDQLAALEARMREGAA